LGYRILNCKYKKRCSSAWLCTYLDLFQFIYNAFHIHYQAILLLLGRESPNARLSLNIIETRSRFFTRSDGTEVNDSMKGKCLRLEFICCAAARWWQICSFLVVDCGLICAIREGHHRIEPSRSLVDHIEEPRRGRGGFTLTSPLASAQCHICLLFQYLH
jgi:hypothetical protein